MYFFINTKITLSHKMLTENRTEFPLTVEWYPVFRVFLEQGLDQMTSLR